MSSPIRRGALNVFAAGVACAAAQRAGQEPVPLSPPEMWRIGRCPRRMGAASRRVDRGLQTWRSPVGILENTARDPEACRATPASCASSRGSSSIATKRKRFMCSSALRRSRQASALLGSNAKSAPHDSPVADDNDTLDGLREFLRAHDGDPWRLRVRVALLLDLATRSIILSRPP